MGLFVYKELKEIVDKALGANLARRRDTLLFAFSPRFAATLPGWQRPPDEALRLDIGDLNNKTWLVDGEVPLSVWLGTAASMVDDPNVAKFFDEMALTAVQRAAAQDVASASATPASMAIPEKILFRSTLLPDTFLSLASERACSVARLSVFTYQNGSPRTLPSGAQDGTFGTGWLIGRRHCITNWHVVAARGSGEPPPRDEDVALQVANMKVEFDYRSTDDQLHPVGVARLAHANRALDYAILELAAAEDRMPFPLAAQLPAIDADHPLAANIIQHPAGEPRRYAIRNNLVAVIEGNDLAYFTDTAGGSSGAPVCDDGWRVIALHKASTAHFGNLNFQGKSTAWVNVGTTITAIVDDLRSNQPALWAALDAVMG